MLHLALHGYADIDFPDRSALDLRAETQRERRRPASSSRYSQNHLNAKLVTLSAWNTGVGPVGEAGVANLVNAFIGAGAESVVSTLWNLRTTQPRD